MICVSITTLHFSQTCSPNKSWNFFLKHFIFMTLEYTTKAWSKHENYSHMAVWEKPHTRAVLVGWQSPCNCSKSPCTTKHAGPSSSPTPLAHSFMQVKAVPQLWGTAHTSPASYLGAALGSNMNRSPPALLVSTSKLKHWQPMLSLTAVFLFLKHLTH